VAVTLGDPLQPGARTGAAAAIARRLQREAGAVEAARLAHPRRSRVPVLAFPALSPRPGPM